MHFLCSDEHHQFIQQELNGGLGFHLRKMIDAYMGKYNKDFAEIEKRLAEIEPEYLSLKKRKEELLKEKAEREVEMRTNDRRVEEAHQKLLELLKNSHNRLDLMPANYFKVYSDFCGGNPSQEALKVWLETEARSKGIIK